MKLTLPLQPESEDCCKESLPLGLGPPFVVGPEGRLAEDLRPLRPNYSKYWTSSGSVDVLQILADAALKIVQDSTNYLFGLHLADLAVTGTMAFQKFCQVQPRDNDVLSKMAAGGTEQQRADAIRLVLDRAYAVTWYLRGWAQSKFAGENLGWIAVSGEDDPPHRPVNVSSSAWPQYDLSVPVHLPLSDPPCDIKLRVRFMIASTGNPPARIDATDRILARMIPPNDTPPCPQGRILLFVHGHSSRLEECKDMLPFLIDSPEFVVIAVDLPGCGYSSFIEPADSNSLILEHETIAPVPLDKLDTSRFPILEFYDRFLCSFVETLSEKLGFDLYSQFAAVIGGSLGGNMGLRLANREVIQAHPWLRHTVSWSPASVWQSLTGVLTGLAVVVPYQKMITKSADGRAEYFKNVFDDSNLCGFIKPQPEYWYRDSWKCKDSYIQTARLERQEIYHEQFRRWHWRVAYEQLLFSHRTNDRINNLTGRTLLVSGERDIGAGLYANAVIFAHILINTPGSSRFLLETGHSIHNERPALLSSMIQQFVSPPELPLCKEEAWSGWAEAAAPLLGASDLTVAENVDGRLELFSIATLPEEPHQRVYHSVQDNLNGDFGDWQPLAPEGIPGDANFFGRVAVGSNADGRLEVYARCHWGDHRLVNSVDSIAKIYQKEAGSWNGAEWDCGDWDRQFIGGWPLRSPAVISRLGKADIWEGFKNWLLTETGGILEGSVEFETNPLTRFQLCAAVNQPAGTGKGTAVQIRGANSYGWWTEGKTLGHVKLDIIDTPVLARNQDGRLEIFVRTQSGQVFHIWETETLTDKWVDDWEQLGDLTLSGPIAVEHNGDGCLWAFGRGMDGELWYCSQTSPNSGWSDWQTLGGSPIENGRPEVAQNAWGGLSIFVRWQDQSLYYLRSNRAGQWSTWCSLGGLCVSDPVVSSHFDGKLQAFTFGSDSSVYTRISLRAGIPPLSLRQFLQWKKADPRAGIRQLKPGAGVISLRSLFWN